MLFIYGRTAPPTSTFHIYLGKPWDGVPLGGEERESMSPVWTSKGWWRSAKEKSWHASRGHRAGSKTTTLRTHRQGR